MFSTSNALQSQTFDHVLASQERTSVSLESLFCRLPLERLEAGSALFWEGDSCKHVFEVVEGVLRVFKIIGDGRRVITGFLYPGDLVGVSIRDRYLYSAEAVVPTKVRRFGRAKFQEEINRSPELGPQLFARLCDEMAAAQDQMVLLSRKNAEERLCSFLLLLARRVQSRDATAHVIELPMTRLDIADYLGLTIETVSRTMTKLTSRGVISPTGRHAIVIRKWEKLVALSGNGDDCDDNFAGLQGSRQAIWHH